MFNILEAEHITKGEGFILQNQIGAILGTGIVPDPDDPDEPAFFATAEEAAAYAEHLSTSLAELVEEMSNR